MNLLYRNKAYYLQTSMIILLVTLLTFWFLSQRELGAIKSGRDAKGNVWQESWREQVTHDTTTGFSNASKHIMREANKCAKRVRTVKHVAHIHDRAHIPIRNIAVESSLGLERRVHLCHETDVPIRHDAVFIRHGTVRRAIALQNGTIALHQSFFLQTRGSRIKKSFIGPSF